MRTAFEDLSSFSGQTYKSSPEALLRSNPRRTTNFEFEGSSCCPALIRPVHCKKRNYMWHVTKGQIEIHAAKLKLLILKNPYKSMLLQYLYRSKISLAFSKDGKATENKVLR